MARAVLFDMGGTLWHAPAWDERGISHLQGQRVAPLLAEWGLAGIEPATFMRALWEQIDERYRRNPELRDPDVLTLIEDAFASHGVTVERRRCEELWKRAYISSRHFGWTLYPDAADLLRALRDLGVRLGIVTNRPHSSALFRRDLADYQIAQLVDAVVCSADVGYVKPHPAPFERALELLSVPPSEAIMVGDLLEVDISGSKALGMTTVWKTNLSDEDLMTYEADYTIGELSELLTLGLFIA